MLKTVPLQNSVGLGEKPVYCLSSSNFKADHRRVVEGALMNICHTLGGNKAFTHEERALNLSSLPLPTQVVEVAVVTETTGTNAESCLPPTTSN